MKQQKKTACLRKCRFSCLECPLEHRPLITPFHPDQSSMCRSNKTSFTIFILAPPLLGKVGTHLKTTSFYFVVLLHPALFVNLCVLCRIYYLLTYSMICLVSLLVCLPRQEPLLILFTGVFQGPRTV